MKILVIVVAVMLSSILMVSFALGNGGAFSGSKHKCPTQQRAAKPFCEWVEDGLALVLDIPLALVSPVVCPIVSPILDRLDPIGPRRLFPKRIRR